LPQIVPGAAVHAHMAPPSTAINSFAMAGLEWVLDYKEATY